MPKQSKQPTLAHEVLEDALFRWARAVKNSDSIDGSEMVDWYCQVFVPHAKAALKGRRISNA